MDLLPIRPVELGVNRGMKYCSNWVEIHGFTPNLTGQNTAQIGLEYMDLLPIRPVEILLKLG